MSAVALERRRKPGGRRLVASVFFRAKIWWAKKWGALRVFAALVKADRWNVVFSAEEWLVTESGGAYSAYERDLAFGLLGADKCAPVIVAGCPGNSPVQYPYMESR